MEYLSEPFDITESVFVEAGRYHWTRYRLEFQTASKRRLTTKFTWWFGTFYNGQMDQYQAQVTWRPSHHLNLSLEGERDLGSLPSGNVDIQLARARLNLFLSPNLQLLSFIQYDNLTKSIGMNTRLRYTYRSLLDIFIVYNRDWLETQGVFQPQVNQFFIKVQYSWRS